MLYVNVILINRSVLAGHVNQAHISWLSANPRLAIGLQLLSQHPIYKVHSVLSSFNMLLRS